MIHLIISLDYEIFGNGSGDVIRDIVDPTERILRICDRYSAKLTIMFEVAEYWAFKKYDGVLKKKLGYSPYLKMEYQIINAVQNGHDVQLHLHPQWIGAKLDKFGLWDLQFDHCSIGYLPLENNVSNGVLSTFCALQEGKKTLESIIKTHNPEYKCIAFRAGGFCIQPESIVINSLKQNGFTIDSSVVKAMVSSEPVEIDYRNAKNNGEYWWLDLNDICKLGNKSSAIVEIPVYSRIELYLKNFNFIKLRSTTKRILKEKNDQNYQRNQQIRSYNNKPIDILRKLFLSHPIKFDFCKLSYTKMIKYIKLAIKEQNSNTEITPIVMIGHSKDFWNDKNFDMFLNHLTNQKLVTFSTFSDIQNKILYRSCN